MKSTEHLNQNGADAKPRVTFEAIREGLEEAVREAVAAHHRAGHPVVVWRGGRIVHLYPDGREVPIDTAEANGERE